MNNDTSIEKRFSNYVGMGLQSGAVITRSNITSYFTHHWLMRNVNQSLDAQKTLHTSPSRASYGVSIVKIWEKIDRVITAPHFISFFTHVCNPIG